MTLTAYLIRVSMIRITNGIIEIKVPFCIGKPYNCLNTDYVLTLFMSHHGCVMKIKKMNMNDDLFFSSSLLCDLS